MIKYIRSSLSVLALGAACAHAATIEAVISPNAIVVRADGQPRVHTIEGRPVLYCGLDAFLGWSAKLIGAQIGPGGAAGAEVTLGGTKQPIATLLAREGWLRPAALVEAAQAAMTERQGGWACAPKTEAFSQMSERIDPKILAGIAMNESAYRGRPWPWTLNVAGRGMFFATREDAYAAIQQLISAQRCDFDVGLMQVNWCYHGRRFESAWAALAPATNIRVAESILAENLQRSGSSVKAVAWYHSADPARGGPYFQRFMNHLSQLESKK
ncbi:transglycosylase SLT domain-containing protein [Cupriavidus basilensis]|uniref:transglycosylase SLT domain-containing protein n=1 Tax=Cupriavidus basilensis TaxID=68895 RepID=UPI0007510C62|nr:transglycosylase SLT domain-containing protein [Cupriavidus basilensis]